MPNTELATQIIEAIEADPAIHNQDAWRQNTPCGTAMCIAGLACFLNGDRFTDLDPSGRVDTVIDSEGHRWGIEERGASLLGIEDHDEVDRLFYEYDNDLALKRLALLAAGDPEWWTYDAE